MTARKQQGRNLAWTIAEEDILRQFYPTTTNTDMAAYLPRHSQQGIQEYAKVIGVTKSSEFRVEKGRAGGLARPKTKNHTGCIALNPPTWSAQEEAVLREFFPTHTPWPKIMAKLPGRTIYGAETWARTKLGLTRPRTGWTEEELAILREEFPFKGGSKLRDKLHKKVDAINRMANTMGLRYVPKSERPTYVKPATLIKKPKRIQPPRVVQPKPEVAAPIITKAKVRKIAQAKIAARKAKPESNPWWKEPHHSDAYKQGLAEHLAGKKKTVFIDEYGRQATSYKVAA
jgi:hypothetical protein